MTEPLTTADPAGSVDPELEVDLARYDALTQQLGRRPGRPLVIEHLGVTDARARKILTADRERRQAPPAAEPRAQRLKVVTPTPSQRQLPPPPRQPATTMRQDAPPPGATHADQHTSDPDHQDTEHDTPVPAATDTTPEPQIATSTTTDAPAGATHQDAPAGGTPSATTTGRQVAPAPATRTPDGARGFYTVATMTLLVSIDTSWRFFGDVLGITNTAERIAMFAVVEAALIACGFAMRAGVTNHGRPGPARMVLWALCGASAYMAIDLSGLVAGLARVVLGPVLGVLMLHLALGIELRHRHQRTTTWARIGRELRERCLSRLGLADDTRDALARTRDRAARRAARLAIANAWITPFRTARLRWNLAKANAAHDEDQRDQVLAELAVAQHATELRDLTQPSPWITKPIHQ